MQGFLVRKQVSMGDFRPKSQGVVVYRIRYTIIICSFHTHFDRETPFPENRFGQNGEIPGPLDKKPLKEDNISL